MKVVNIDCISKNCVDNICETVQDGYNVYKCQREGNCQIGIECYGHNQCSTNFCSGFNNDISYQFGKGICSNESEGIEITNNEIQTETINDFNNIGFNYAESLNLYSKFIQLNNLCNNDLNDINKISGIKNNYPYYKNNQNSFIWWSIDGKCFIGNESSMTDDSDSIIYAVHTDNFFTNINTDGTYVFNQINDENCENIVNIQMRFLGDENGEESIIVLNQKDFNKQIQINNLSYDSLSNSNLLIANYIKNDLSKYVIINNEDSIDVRIIEPFTINISIHISPNSQSVYMDNLINYSIERYNEKINEYFTNYLDILNDIQNKLNLFDDLSSIELINLQDEYTIDDTFFYVPVNITNIEKNDIFYLTLPVTENTYDYIENNVVNNVNTSQNNVANMAQDILDSISNNPYVSQNIVNEAEELLNTVEEQTNNTINETSENQTESATNLQMSSNAPSNAPTNAPTNAQIIMHQLMHQLMHRVIMHQVMHQVIIHHRVIMHQLMH